MKWLSYYKKMEQLNQISLERCLCPVVPVEPPTLCVFADASRGAFGTSAYLRSEEPTGAVNVRFVAAKSRVAPLKELTIPRLELQAAVLASRLCKTIENEVRLFLRGFAVKEGGSNLSFQAASERYKMMSSLFSGDTFLQSILLRTIYGRVVRSMEKLSQVSVPTERKLASSRRKT